jgi:tetratricopeptide (TPR) repeat protein
VTSHEGQALTTQHGKGPITLGKSLAVLGLALVVNSAYIAAFSTPDIFYVGNDLIHPFLGLLVAILLVVYAVRNRAFFKGWAAKAALGLLGVAAGFGIYLAIAGMTRPHSIELYIHVGSVTAGLFFLLVHLRSRVAARVKGENQQPATESAGEAAGEVRPSIVDSRLWRACAAVMAASLLFYGGVASYHHFWPNPYYIITNPSSPPMTMAQEGAGAGSLMFPSSAQTSDGKPINSTFFMNSESCQRCHPDIYAQWKSSMHHFASFNNQWYRKAVEYMQDTVGIKPSLWCGGCHDHALSIADKMQKYPIRELENTPAGQNGLGCMSCHAIVHVDSTMGQGGITFEYPKLAEMAESKNPFLRFLHDYDVRLDPKPHREAFLKPFHKDRGETPRFCSACHKVHLDVPVNHYRWIRGFDDYDNWQASGVSGQGARSFYYPPKPEECEDCHMPLVRSNDFGNINGYVHSHRFAAANTAVPTSHGDETQVADVEKFLKGAVTVDIFALAQEPAETSIAVPSAASAGPQLASTFAVGEESAEGLTSPLAISAPPARLEAPLGRANAVLHPGETARVEVVVRTRRVGHFFPGGTVDAFDCWVELQARDSKGRIIFWSGEVADNGKGPVDPGAHFYRSLQLDEHGNVINKRNAWSTHATVYARLIPPGAADTVHYRLKVPRDAGDHITFTAKLNYRKFDWWITQWAFAGARDPSNPHPDVTKDYDDGQWVFTGSTAGDSENIKGIPNVPIVVISEDTKTVPVTPLAKGEPDFQEAVTLNPNDWERWNDYGIGLLLQGDLKGAERAFKVVTKERPGYADGWVNVARALVQEGNTEAAKPMLAKAMELDPNLASAHYFDGLALKADGDYPDAFHQFSLAAARYPNDRVNRDQMGRMLFLQRKYRRAVEEYQRTLSIDPEDLDAHYNLMLCYRGLDEDALATREEHLYLRFKANEIAQAITGAYKLAHPEDNNEAQPIHEHESVNLADLQRAADYGQPHASKRAVARTSIGRGTRAEGVARLRRRHESEQAAVRDRKPDRGTADSRRAGSTGQSGSGHIAGGSASK